MYEIIINNIIPLFVPIVAMSVMYFQFTKESFKKIWFIGTFFLLVFQFLFTEIIAIIIISIGIYLYTLKTRKQKHTSALFYTLSTIFWTFLLADVFGFIMFLLAEDFVRINYDIIHYISWFFPIVVNFFTINLFDLDLDILSNQEVFIEKQIIRPMNKMIGISFFTYLFLLIIFESVSNVITYNSVALLFVFVNLLLYFIFIGLLSTKIKAYLYVQIEREKDQRYKQLEQYTDDIEGMQKEIAGFKHDIKNIWISFSEIIRSEDIVLIESEFNEIKEALKVKLVNTETVSHDLSNLQNGVVKGLLHQKAILAKQQGISIQIDIQNVINQICMDKLDFVRVLGILLDNAIEEAVESKKKNLVVGIVCEEKHIIIEIINSTDRKHIPINNIFKYGYSTKEGEDRGKGLAVVSDIIEETSNVELKTECSNNSFSQSLKIWNENENKYSRR